MREFLWNPDPGYGNVNPPLTEEAVKRAEAALGVRLPLAYLEQLRRQNGGYIRYDGFPLNDKELFRVDGIAGIGPNQGLVQKYELAVHEWGIDPAFVPITGDGHTWIVFDYRNGGDDPPLAYVEVDPSRVVPLAGSFAALTAVLIPATHWWIFGLATKRTEAELMADLGELLHCSFQREEHLTRGGKYVSISAEHPEWPGRHEELARLNLRAHREGKFDSWPEDPRADYILEVEIREDLADRIRAGLGRGGYEFRLLHRPHPAA